MHKIHKIRRHIGIIRNASTVENTTQMQQTKEKKEEEKKRKKEGGKRGGKKRGKTWGAATAAATAAAAACTVPRLLNSILGPDFAINKNVARNRRGTRNKSHIKT